MAGGGGAGGIFSIGKSKARVFDEKKETRVTFQDVAGLEGAKEEVQEIITENAFGKRQKTYKKTKYNNKIGICKCCKHKTIKETKQRI